jgi:hypothetical protein
VFRISIEVDGDALLAEPEQIGAIDVELVHLHVGGHQCHSPISAAPHPIVKRRAETRLQQRVDRLWLVHDDLPVDELLSVAFDR